MGNWNADDKACNDAEDHYKDSAAKMQMSHFTSRAKANIGNGMKQIHRSPKANGGLSDGYFVGYSHCPRTLKIIIPGG